MTALFNGRSSKNQSNWSFVSDLSSDLSLTAQWGNNWLAIFTTSNRKRISFYPSRCKIPLSIRLHALSAYWVSDSLQSSNGSHRWNILLKMLEKCSAHSITSESIWSGVIFTRFKWCYCCHIWTGTAQSSFPDLINFKIVLVALWGWGNIFFAPTSLLAGATLEASG